MDCDLIFTCIPSTRCLSILSVATYVVVAPVVCTRVQCTYSYALTAVVLWIASNCINRYYLQTYGSIVADYVPHPLTQKPCRNGRGSLCWLWASSCRPEVKIM